MTNILLPTDFSDNAWSAIIYTLKLYQHETCKFYLLNTEKVASSRISSFSNKLLKTMLDNARKDVEKLKEQIEATNANSNHEFEAMVVLGDLDDVIEDFVPKYNIDLIAMGTKGATGAKGILFGSNTAKIFKKVKNCPILAIPNDYEFITPKQIAFPTDLNRYCDAKEIHHLQQLADLYNAKIRIVHINDNEALSDKQEKNLNVLKEYLKNFELSVHIVPSYASKETSIHDFIDELDIDILAMVYYSHSFIDGILREPVVKKIAFNLKVPFLVIPE
ncbi:nucleotide-binding universal stress UspA family protein [Kordia periserrulae]|uniref:Nucleotide-binding universal stress UspA family protein n=1 Tax=Kordia periserrulae TaxID=701523 RepID=A0A2T6C1U7_9FLAO|nr:universal stress protein [Kordia periserrulae]PTX62281.1 nucleotide-binding universal stress UspA family protein [Kordia periserrulae]